MASITLKNGNTLPMREGGERLRGCNDIPFGKWFTPTEMKRENDYLREHPEVMAEELRWMGLVMPSEEEKNFADLRSEEAIEVIVGKRPRARNKRAPR